VAAWVGAPVMADLRAIPAQITQGGLRPPILYGRRRLLFMLHALALVTAPAHVSDLIADDGPFI
jgi:hypothetical protein